MALARDQHTPIEWSLTRLFRYLRAELGRKKKRALDEMEYRRAEGHLRVIVREYDADGKPQGDPFDLPTDKAHELVYDQVWVYPRGLKLGHRCTVTEQNARDLWPPRPPASQAAPDQQLEDKVGLDPIKTEADRPPAAPASDPPKRVSTQEWVTAAAKRLKEADKIPANAKRHPTDFAKLLEKRMQKAWNTDKSIRLVGWRHIKNHLREWGLWPIESIKI